MLDLTTDDGVQTAIDNLVRGEGHYLFTRSELVKFAPAGVWHRQACKLDPTAKPAGRSSFRVVLESSCIPCQRYILKNVGRYAGRWSVEARILLGAARGVDRGQLTIEVYREMLRQLDKAAKTAAPKFRAELLEARQRLLMCAPEATRAEHIEALRGQLRHHGITTFVETPTLLVFKPEGRDLSGEDALEGLRIGAANTSVGGVWAPAFAIPTLMWHACENYLAKPASAQFHPCASRELAEMALTLLNDGLTRDLPTALSTAADLLH